MDEVNIIRGKKPFFFGVINFKDEVRWNPTMNCQYVRIRVANATENLPGWLNGTEIMSACYIVTLSGYGFHYLRSVAITFAEGYASAIDR